MIIHGDCLEKLKEMPDNSVDSIVTDPPYGLLFMGKKWDYDVPSVEIWKECLRVLKPGGYLLAFAGTRTQHRMAVRIEDAGFEIRDLIFWCYGSGFPKSTRINRWDVFCQCALNKHSTESTDPAPREDGHTHTDHASADDDPLLQDAPHSTRKPLDSPVDCRVVGDLNDEPSQTCLEGAQEFSRPPEYAQEHNRSGAPSGVQDYESLRNPSPAQRIDRPSSLDCSPLDSAETDAGSHISASSKPSDTSKFSSNKQGSSQGFSYKNGLAKCLACGKPNVDGFGTALKPALEPITLARKPLSESTVAKNVLKHGTGGINIDATRIRVEETDNIYAKNPNTKSGFGHASASIYGTSEGAPKYNPSQGRFPANLILDEIAGEMLDEQSGQLSQCGGPKKTTHDAGMFGIGTPGRIYAEANRGASRFFYCAKASKSERGKDNTHPTVKPLKLMSYLCRLITPPNGIVLDPFMGSGSTGVAAKSEGFNFIGIEREEQYVEIARQRMKAPDTKEQDDER